jgi:hypothetical protein
VQAVVVQVRGDPDVRARVQQRVGDDLADQEYGGLGEVLATRVDQQLSDPLTCLRDAGGLWRQKDVQEMTASMVFFSALG